MKRAERADGSFESDRRYLHAEAFCTMVYKCLSCGHEERIWNSRDGVTPFIVPCELCGGEAQHYDWRRLDKREPDHVLVLGERVFIDMPEGVARAILWRRVRAVAGTPYELKGERAKEFVDQEAAAMVARREPLLVRIGGGLLLAPPCESREN